MRFSLAVKHEAGSRARAADISNGITFVPKSIRAVLTALAAAAAIPLMQVILKPTMKKVQRQQQQGVRDFAASLESAYCV